MSERRSPFHVLRELEGDRVNSYARQDADTTNSGLLRLHAVGYEDKSRDG